MSLEEKYMEIYGEQMFNEYLEEERNWLWNKIVGCVGRPESGWDEDPAKLNSLVKVVMIESPYENDDSYQVASVYISSLCAGYAFNLFKLFDQLPMLAGVDLHCHPRFKYIRPTIGSLSGKQFHAIGFDLNTETWVYLECEIERKGADVLSSIKCTPVGFFVSFEDALLSFYQYSTIFIVKARSIITDNENMMLGLETPKTWTYLQDQMHREYRQCLYKGKKGTEDSHILSFILTQATYMNLI